jgi:metal-sulfur cluster biosynthetic enzyme
MPVSEAAIHEELKQVIDPELFVNIVDLGLIYVVNVIPQEDGATANVEIEMTMTSPACPAGPQLIADAKRVVSGMEGVGQVQVKVVMEPAWTPDRMTEEARDELGMF